MKNVKPALALFVCLATLASCDSSTKKENAANPLIGQWKIDSIASKDSNDFGILLLAMSLQNRDSAKYDMSFATDTVTFLQKDTISKSKYQYNAVTKEVTIIEDSTVFAYQTLNDSLVSLTSKDSTTLFLKKSK